MPANANTELDRLFRDAAVAMLITDLDGRILQANDAFCSLVGYQRHQLAGLPVREITHPGDVVINRDVLGEGLPAGANSWVFEKRYLKTGGGVVWVQNSCSFLHDDAGTPHRIVIFSQDITSQRILEQTLRKSEWRFRSIVESLPVAISILDRGGKIAYESPFVETLLGYTPHERVGCTASDYIHPDDRVTVENSWRSDLAAHYDATVAVEARCLNKDGSWRAVEFVGRNLLHNPVIAGILLLARDVTHRTAARNQVLEYAAETERKYFEVLNRLAKGRSQEDRAALLALVDDTRPALLGIESLLGILAGTKLTETQVECVRKIQDSVGTLLKAGDWLGETYDRSQPAPEEE